MCTRGCANVNVWRNKLVVKTVGFRQCPSTPRHKMVIVTCSTLFRNSVASCSPANLRRNHVVFLFTAPPDSSNIHHNFLNDVSPSRSPRQGTYISQRITQLVKICSPVHVSPTRLHRFLLQQLRVLSGCPVLTFAVPTLYVSVYFKMCCSSPRSNSQ